MINELNKYGANNKTFSTSTLSGQALSGQALSERDSEGGYE